VKVIASPCVKPSVEANTPEMVDAEAIGKAVTRPTMLIEIAFCLASSVFGKVTVSTSFLKVALILSPATGEGNRIIRAKAPWARSTTWWYSSLPDCPIHLMSGAKCLPSRREARGERFCPHGKARHER
jgi:hypothetical protein